MQTLIVFGREFFTNFPAVLAVTNPKGFLIIMENNQGDCDVFWCVGGPGALDGECGSDTGEP